MNALERSDCVKYDLHTIDSRFQRTGCRMLSDGGIYDSRRPRCQRKQIIMCRRSSSMRRHAKAQEFSCVSLASAVYPRRNQRDQQRLPEQVPPSAGHKNLLCDPVVLKCQRS